MYLYYITLDAPSYTPGTPCSQCPFNLPNCYNDLCTDLSVEEAKTWNPRERNKAAANTNASALVILLNVICALISVLFAN